MDTGYSTTDGASIKDGSIVTGMDRLVNPVSPSEHDQIFDSSPARDINSGERKNEGGISYKGLKAGNPLKD